MKSRRTLSSLVALATLVGALVVAGACNPPPPPAPPPLPPTIGEKIKSSHDSMGAMGDPSQQLGKAPDGMPSPHAGGHGSTGGGMSKSRISGLPMTAPILKVDDDTFTRADLERTMSQAAALAGIPPDVLDGEMKDAFEAPAYEKLIERALLGKEAKKRNLWPSDDEAKKSREEMIKSLPKGKSLDDVLKAMNTDEAAFAKDVAADVAIGKLLKALEAEMPEPPKELVDKLYDANKKVFVVPDTASAAHILLKVDRGAGADVLAAKQKTANEYRDYLKGKGEREFIELAKEKSDDSATKPRGGDLGTFKRGDLFPELEAVAFKLKEGELGVVQTDRGFHVLRGGGVEKGHTIPEKEAKAIIAEREKVKAFMQKVDDVTEELRKGAKVERLVEPLPSPLMNPNDTTGTQVPDWKASGKNVQPGMMSPH